jgi:hypothetical protein
MAWTKIIQIYRQIINKLILMIGVIRIPTRRQLAIMVMAQRQEALQQQSEITQSMYQGRPMVQL